MPNTPVTWRDQQTVNFTTAGAQFDPDIIQLANGNILVCWVTDEISPRGINGTGIRGQIFDPLGEMIGSEIRLRKSSNDNELEPQIAALPTGGFVLANQSVHYTGEQGSGWHLSFFDANVMTPRSGTGPEDRDEHNLIRNSNPHIAVSSGTSMLVAYDNMVGGISKVRCVYYDQSTGIFRGPITLIDLPGGNTVADVAVLANGNYVIVANNLSADSRIVYRIMTPGEATVRDATIVAGTDTNGFSDREASVVGLAGGGFVICWTNTDANDTDILFRVYDSVGTQVGSGIAFDEGATDNNNEAKVIALADGTFVIACDNDEAAEDNAGPGQIGIDVQHFSATGTLLGTTFRVSADNANSISGVGLADGRVALVWDLVGGEIQLEILDTRDAANNPGVYTPDQWVIGTPGNDVFTPDANAEFVHGWAGNDVITETGGPRPYFGEDGNDTIKVTSVIDGDLHDGGDGIDTVDWSGAAIVGATYNLTVGTATLGAASEVMVNFENFVGTANRDIVIGTVLDNVLIGGGGDDLLNGSAGVDTMSGGAGDDFFVVDVAGDRVIEALGQGNDIVSTRGSYALAPGQEIERLLADDAASTAGLNLVGNEFAQVIAGNAGANLIRGLGGADILIGRGGDDTYFISDASARVREDVGGGNDVVYTTVSYVLEATREIELLLAEDAGATTALSLVGNEFAQVIAGNAGANNLRGGGGADILIGRGGDDSYFVTDAAAVVRESVGEGRDIVYTTVSYTLAATQEIEVLAINDVASTNSLDLTGNVFGQVLAGNAGANVLDGKAGADTLVGQGGADSFAFTSALGGGNVDWLYDYQVGVDRILLDDAIFAGLAPGALPASAFAVGSAAADANDRIIYNPNSGALFFDADGSGAGAAVQFARVAPGLNLTASEFTVI